MKEEHSMTDLSFYRNKKIFITGHTGFKGTWLCHILLQAGADISAFALEAPPGESLFVQTELEKKINSIMGDVRDREKLISAVKQSKPDIVFHLAAQALVRPSYQEPAITYETNVMGTVNILEAVRQSPSVRSFVNITTDKVYEEKEWCWGYRENENLCGFDPYSNSKSCSELVTSSYRNSFFQNEDAPSISTARAGNAIGGGDYARDRIIPDCIRAVNAGKEIIVRNPHSIRPYQHVLDCLSGYLVLAEKQYHNKSIEGAYNFGTDDASCVTTGELVSMFCTSWGGGASWRTENDNGPHESNFLKLDCSKAKSVLGWEQHWDIENAIKKIAEFEKLKTAKSRCVENQIKEYLGLQGVASV
jgi:CDP-glucose 4,6-dehydratase